MPRPVSSELLHELTRATESLLGSDVRACAAHLEGTPPPLFADEEAAVRGAIDKRRREFAWGRALARQGLDALGVPACALPRRSDRAPGWPADTWGSITHTDEVALTAVARGPGARASFGIDLEGDEPLGPDLRPHVLRSEEMAVLGPHEAGRLAKIVFSAKEAFYKAQHRHTGTLLDFLDVALVLDPSRRRFRVEVHHRARNQLPPEPWEGSWAEVGPFVLTAVRLPAARSSTARG